MVRKFTSLFSITLFFIVFQGAMLAQPINYSFSALSGAFSANASPITVMHNAGVDDALSSAQNIGFTFQYGCVNYTQFKASSNGWMTFNTAIVGSNLTNNLNTSSDRPIIAPLWDDLAVGTGGSVNYKLTGASPNRVLTIEWLNMEWNYAATNPAISFQVKLYETSNRIEFVYRQQAAAVNSGGASIGLSGIPSGNFYSLQSTGASPAVSQVTEVTTLNTKPATGQIYRWDPVACSGTPNGGTAVASPTSFCGTFTSNLSLSGSTSGCGITYQWQRASAPAGPYTNIAGATSSTANVTNTVTTYYRCVLSCGASTAASSAATCSVTTAGSCGLCSIISIGSLPFSSGAQSTCGNGNNVTSANVSNVCGSSAYYGGEDAVYSFTPGASGAVTVGVTSGGSWMGLVLYQGCPISGGTCVGSAQSSAGNQSLCVTVTAGQTYYVVIDSWPAPNCNPYNLSVSAPGGCVGSISSGTAAASPSTACGTLTTNLSLTGISACGATYQWQSSTSPGGPFSNIVGATSTTAQVTTTVSTYYRVLLTCGGSTAVSTTASTSVSSFTPPPCSLSTYSSTAIAYSFDSFVGTTLPTTDDVLFSSVSTFGFPFCYSGQQASGGYVASNSSFVFDGLTCYPNIYPMPGAVYAAPGIGTGWSISTPAPTNADYTPRNAILGPWQDTNPGAGGTIRMTTIGTAPNRRFVISWENIPMFSCTTLSFTGQIKLYETSNNVEIHIGNKPVCTGWNSGRAIMGLHNYDGSIYIPPVNNTAHNSPTQWTMTNSAYRFSTSCPAQSNCAVPLPIGFKALYGQNIDGVNKLWWETSEETNVISYEVDRSLDGKDFTLIGSVAAEGKPNLYLFNDMDFKRGFINYYRVTAIESDGSRTSTNIYPIVNTDDKMVVNAIYPNPASDVLNVAITGRGAYTECTLKVYDQFGRLMNEKPQRIKFGMNRIALNIESLPKGLYILEISAPDNSVISNQKFSKQ